MRGTHSNLAIKTKVKENLQEKLMLHEENVDCIASLQKSSALTLLRSARKSALKTAFQSWGNGSNKNVVDVNGAIYVQGRKLGSK